METSVLLLFVLVIIFLSVFLVFLHINTIRTYYYRIRFVESNDSNQLALEIAEIYKKYRDPVVGFAYFFVTPALIIRDLELAKCILSKDFNCFQNRGLFYNEIDDPLSAILGTIEHADWCSMKKKISPSFKPAKMKSIFPQINDMCNEIVGNLIEEIDINGKWIEIIELFSRFAIDFIGTIAFGEKSNESDARLFRNMILKAKKPYLKFPLKRFAAAFPKVARFLRFRKHSKEVTDFFVKYVFEIVKYRTENNINQNDFIQSLIDEGLKIHQIAAIGFDLLSTGYIDSTSTLAYCLYELSIHKTIQDKAREEINSVLENEEFTYAVLQKMRYVNQIIKEAERKYPVAGFATRVANQTYVAPNADITISSGMKVFIPIYGIHHDDRYYANPETFDPDRFTKESMKKRPQYAFLPFGAGPRQCIGTKFAEMMISVGLVKLLQNFEFSTCPLTKIPIQFNKHKNTLHPESGVILNVQRV